MSWLLAIQINSKTEKKNLDQKPEEILATAPQLCGQLALVVNPSCFPPSGWPKEEEEEGERGKERKEEIKTPAFPACPPSLQRSFRFKLAWVCPLLFGGVVLGPYAGPCLFKTQSKI